MNSEDMSAGQTQINTVNGQLGKVRIRTDLPVTSMLKKKSGKQSHSQGSQKIPKNKLN
jgi:hypothetical protein